MSSVGHAKPKYLEVTVARDGRLAVTLGPAVDANVGLRCRKQIFEKRVVLEMRRSGVQSSNDSTGNLKKVDHSGMDNDKVISAIERIDRFIDRFSNQPLTPRMVEEVLGISSKECRRWSKDGRLRRSGTASFKRGQAIQIYTHSVETVAALANDPSIIASWRAHDAASARLGVD